MAWLYLIIGGLFEVGFTTCMRFVEGFRNVPWTLGFLACTAASLLLLEMATRTVPMATSYVVWGGIGALGTTLVGMIWFGEPVSGLRLGLIIAIIACIAGLKAISGPAV